jgi:hypothetical protein
LDEILFVFADGCEAFHELRDVGFVDSGIVARQQDGAAGQAGFHGVQG